MACEVAREYLREAGDDESEAADLTGLSRVSAGKLLAALTDAHQLKGSRAERIGRGYFYIPVNPDS